jgi:beta-carotene 3-hydroxylase
MSDVAIALGGLIAMEPITALLHRVVFHGFGFAWHRSHHEPPRRVLEGNDLFPVVFAAATIALLSVGVWIGGGEVLVPLGVGITAYGFSYLVVHDVIIHRRIPGLRIPDGALARLRRAHNVHHLFSRAPYGFLVPVVPKELAARTDELDADRTCRTVTRAHSHDTRRRVSA